MKPIAADSPSSPTYIDITNIPSIVPKGLISQPF